MSPHDGTTVYAAAQVVFRSVNGGQSWEAISPDLTRNDKAKQNGGRLEEYYSTIFTLAESPREKGVIWTGSDDGLVHVTRNGGRDWKNVTPPDVQPFTRINIIDASPHDPGTAYVAANRYQLDDVRPYIYKTTDFGRSWQPIVGGLPERGFVRTVREDPVKKDLLFAGTESAVYYSPDGGAHWQPLQLNHAGRPDHRPDDQERRPRRSDARARVLGARRHHAAACAGRRRDDGATVPAAGRLALATSGLRPRRRARRAESARWRRHHLRVANRTARDHRVPRCQRRAREESVASGERNGPSAAAGMHRFVWDMRYPDAAGIEEGTFLAGGNLRGPVAPPGTYQVRLTAGGQTMTQPLRIVSDPKSQATAADLQKQFELLLAIRDKVSAVHSAVNDIQSIRTRLSRDQSRDRRSCAPRSTPSPRNWRNGASAGSTTRCSSSISS